MTGPSIRTIIAFANPPTSADTNARANRMSDAPIVASRTPSQ